MLYCEYLNEQLYVYGSSGSLFTACLAVTPLDVLCRLAVNVPWCIQLKCSCIHTHTHKYSFGASLINNDRIVTRHTVHRIRVIYCCPLNNSVVCLSSDHLLLLFASCLLLSILFLDLLWQPVESAKTSSLRFPIP